MSIQTKTMVVKSDTALAETKTTIRDTVTFDTSKLPNGITYKGLKAVLSFADPIQWNKASTYDSLTVVWDDATHASYASKRPVPQNIELTNEFYWFRTADLDAQVEMYRQEVMELNGRVTENARAITENARAIAAETARAEGADQALQEKMVKLNSFSSDFQNTFLTKELFFSVDYNDYLALGYPSIQGSAYDAANDTLYLCAHNAADTESIMAKYTNFKNGGTDRKWSSYIKLKDNHHCGGACFFDNKVFVNDYNYNTRHITVVDCTTFTELEQIVLPYHGLIGIAGFKNINNNDENNSVRMLVGRGDNGNVINGYAYDTSTYPYVFKNICTIDELNANIQYSQGMCMIPSGVICLYSYVFNQPFKTSYISIKPVITAGRECVYPVYQNPDEPFEELEDVFHDGMYIYTNTVNGKIYKLCPVGALNLQSTWYGNLVTDIVFTRNKGTIEADSNKVTFDNYWCYRLNKKVIENDSVHIPVTVSFHGMVPLVASISAAQKTVHLCKRTSDFKKVDLFFDAYLTAYGNTRFEEFSMSITDTNGSITWLRNLNEIINASEEKYRITDITIGLA